MKETAGFRARQLAWRTLASALLFLAVGAYVPPDAAAASIPLPEVSPALCPPQGILVVYGERYVTEDDGVLVFRRRPVEVYTDTGQLVGIYTAIGDAPVRLDVPPGNYVVAFQSDGKMEKIRAYVKDGEETIVPAARGEQPTPRASISPR